MKQLGALVSYDSYMETMTAEAYGKRLPEDTSYCIVVTHGSSISALIDEALQEPIARNV
jgi:hypothetical protein